MSLTFRKGFSPEALIEQIKRIRVFTKDGSIAFNGFGYQFWENTITSSLDFGEKDQHLCTKAISDALRSPDLKSDFSPQEFLRDVSRHLSLLENEWLKPFRVIFHLTQIEIRPRTMLQSGTLIRINPPKGGKFIRTAETVRAEIARLHEAELTRRPYDARTLVVVNARALNPDHAHALARDTLDEMRGLLNLLITDPASSAFSLRRNV